jgi:hypothetical protein
MKYTDKGHKITKNFKEEKVTIKTNDSEIFDKIVSKYIRLGFIPIKTILQKDFIFFRTKNVCKLIRDTSLEKKFKQAIENEDYELANELNKELKKKWKSAT